MDFIEQRADSLIALKQLAKSKEEEFGERYRELLNDPNERDLLIVTDAVGYLSERYQEETGDSELASSYLDQLVSFAVQPWADIMAIPIPTRGSLFSTGASLVSAIASQQAAIEIYGVEAWVIGDNMGKANRKSAKALSPKGKRKMSTEGGITETIAEKEQTDK